MSPAIIVLNAEYYSLKFNNPLKYMNAEIVHCVLRFKTKPVTLPTGEIFIYLRFNGIGTDVEDSQVFQFTASNEHEINLTHLLDRRVKSTNGFIYQLHIMLDQAVRGNLVPDLLKKESIQLQILTRLKGNFLKN